MCLFERQQRLLTGSFFLDQESVLEKTLPTDNTRAFSLLSVHVKLNQHEREDVTMLFYSNPNWVWIHTQKLN